MAENYDNLLVMQVVFGAVLIIFGMMMLFLMQTMNVFYVYIAVAMLCFTYGMTQLLAAVIQITKKGS